MLCCSDFAFECIEELVVYLNIIKEGNQLKKSAATDLLTDKVVELYFALHWLGNFKMPDRLVRRLTCAPATTSLTP